MLSTMLLVPLEDIVVFPNMNVTLTVDVGAEERVLLVPRHENDYASVGTVAEVTDRVRLPGGGRAVALNGLHRGVIEYRGKVARGHGIGVVGRLLLERGGVEVADVLQLASRIAGKHAQHVCAPMSDADDGGIQHERPTRGQPG